MLVFSVINPCGIVLEIKVVKVKLKFKNMSRYNVSIGQINKILQLWHTVVVLHLQLGIFLPTCLIFFQQVLKHLL